MQTVIESVPNISEGRDAATLEALRAAADSVAGARLLNHSADPSHNRSVFTIVGAPVAVSEAVFCLCAKAAELVDMRRHTGVHPCVGAADVVPFIPLQNATMGDCISLAESFAARLWQDLHIPCILYGKAARAPHRQRLAEIRRGGFASLKDKLRDPLWHPDVGTASPHPAAGLTAVGARDVLIAYNVNLDSDDVQAAKDIARELRTSSGGLPGVQALGLFLEERGAAQVSMNLTDYRATGVIQVFEAVREAAGKRGLSVLCSELIGAAPREALPVNPAETLLMEDFDPDMQILENAY